MFVLICEWRFSLQGTDVSKEEKSVRRAVSDGEARAGGGQRLKREEEL